LNYNNRTFRPISNSENGEVSDDKMFHYKQVGNVLTCEYARKNATKGHLIGLVDSEGNIEMRYHPLNAKVEWMTGVCFSNPEIMKNGKIRLHETWQWTSGDLSKGSSVLEEV